MKKQRGFATLLVSSMILMLISLNVFIGAKGSVVEQKIANNQYRTEEAFQNAEAGVAELIENIENSKAYILANPVATDFSSVNITTAMSAGRFSASFDIINVININGINNINGTITSVGFGSGNSTRTVTQRMKIVAGSAGSAGGAAALNALGYVELGGSTSATSVKAGGKVEGNMTSGGNSSEFKVNLLDHLNNILMDNGKPVQRSMTADEYFMYWFGGLCPIAKAASKAIDCKSEVKLNVSDPDVNGIVKGKGYICAADCATKTEDKNIYDAYSKQGKRVFWLESGGIDNSIDMGTESDPVLIFIMNIADGSKAAKINANSTIYGVVYIDITDQRTTTACSCNASNSVISTSVSSAKTTPVWGSISYALNITIPAQPPACTVSACEAAATKCTPADPSTATIVGTVSICTYTATAVSGSNNTPVQIEVTGTWGAGGTGKSKIYGAAITSGNYEGTGNANYIQNSTVIKNSVLGGVGGLGAIGGSGFNTIPVSTVSISIDPHGWNDAN